MGWGWGADTCSSSGCGVGVPACPPYLHLQPHSLSRWKVISGTVLGSRARPAGAARGCGPWGCGARPDSGRPSCLVPDPPVLLPPSLGRSPLDFGTGTEHARLQAWSVGWTFSSKLLSRLPPPWLGPRERHALCPPRPVPPTDSGSRSRLQPPPRRLRPQDTGRPSMALPPPPRYDEACQDPLPIRSTKDSPLRFSPTAWGRAGGAPRLAGELKGKRRLPLSMATGKSGRGVAVPGAARLCQHHRRRPHHGHRAAQAANPGAPLRPSQPGRQRRGALLLLLQAPLSRRARKGRREGCRCSLEHRELPPEGGAELQPSGLLGEEHGSGAGVGVGVRGAAPALAQVAAGPGGDKGGLAPLSPWACPPPRADPWLAPPQLSGMGGSCGWGARRGQRPRPINRVQLIDLRIHHVEICCFVRAGD